ncbi:uncharacterized protein PAN0_006c3059 [Moesziomyces antarcticus]|uniref:Uncharacterized protein n=2 Tax=Pseudozyma antarctica TaxID=84753 RepID=A0A081CDU8_PSEA2|nr:uncharacterized protein PAN0_006c3059 [Moesziomyces antarcticus]GAK64844.1 conserved hypothetical protein [Moesziomyces antarcticus]SPO45839.1 uncharacterized protein PSANT_03525 [Moesziomyces antarcticus]
MNSVKKVLSRRSHSGDDSSDDGRLSSSTAPTSNPGSPVQRQKEMGTLTGAGVGAAGVGATTATTNGTHTRETTGDKIKDKIEHGLGRSADVHAKDGSIRHKHGHDVLANKHLDLSNGEVVQDVQHLAPVTHQTHQRHEVEEVLRQKEHHRHVHHIQHHTQPVLDSEHAAEQVHNKIHPVTKVHETHASTDKDATLLTSVAGQHADKYAEAPLHRQVIDKGEVVKEHIHHHIHNVVQPIIEKDTHEYHRIQTTIPTHVVTHEAPIVHESTHHKAVSKDEFLSGGGNLTNSIRSIHDAKLLNTGKCDRKVDGLAEKLERELGVKPTLTSTVDARNTPAVV